MDMSDDWGGLLNLPPDKEEKSIKPIFYKVTACILLVLIGMLLSPALFSVDDIPSPSDWLKEEDVEISTEMVCVFGDYEIARIGNSSSMDPVIDKTSLVITKKDINFSDLFVGDIVSYKNEEGNLIVHRIIKKYKEGYYMTRGDNNIYPDEQKVYPSDIDSLIVGILY